MIWSYSSDDIKHNEAMFFLFLLNIFKLHCCLLWRICKYVFNMTENQTKDALRIKASESAFWKPNAGVLFNVPTTEKRSSASIRSPPSNWSSCPCVDGVSCFGFHELSCHKRLAASRETIKSFFIFFFLLHMATSLLTLMSWKEVSISVQDYFYLQ